MYYTMYTVCMYFTMYTVCITPCTQYVLHHVHNMYYVLHHVHNYTYIYSVCITPCTQYMYYTMCWSCVYIYTWIYTDLSGDCVGSRGEELGDAGSFEAQVAETKGSTEACSSCSDYHSVVLMVHHGIVTGHLTVKV